MILHYKVDGVFRILNSFVSRHGIKLILSSLLGYLVCIKLLNAYSNPNENVLFDESCRCRSEENDIYESPQKFNMGVFRGQCIDMCRFRSVQVLDSQFATQTTTQFITAAHSHIKVANLLHAGKFYIAEIPIDTVKMVEVGFEEFLPNVYHVFLKFNLLHDIHLIDQVNPQVSKKISSVVISAEGVTAKNQKYSMAEAYLDNYLLAIRFLSADEMTSQAAKHKNHVFYYPIKLNEKDVQKLFKKALSESQRLALSRRYGLFSDNCATTAFDLLMSVVKQPRIEFQAVDLYRLRSSLSANLPYGVIDVLRELQIID